jgi:arsenite methyltransferase
MTNPDYGIDAPGVIRNLALGAVALLVLGFLATPTARGAWPFAAVCFIEAIWMVWASRIGKFLQRDVLLNRITWRGDERILDLGCGRGLLLIGAAGRLVAGGSAVGIDLWSAEDLSGNSKDATLANAAMADVADRVTVETGDMRKLPFPDASFDLIVSSMAIHNIYDVAGRAQAIDEAVRVLKPGGRLLLQDFRHTAQYAAVLRGIGCSDVARIGPSFRIFPPVHVVEARK